MAKSLLTHYSLLFSQDYQITLVNCRIADGAVVANLSRFDSNLLPGTYQLKENAVTPVCQIILPEWAISDETLIFLELIELKIVTSDSFWLLAFSP